MRKLLLIAAMMLAMALCVGCKAKAKQASAAEGANNEDTAAVQNENPQDETLQDETTQDTGEQGNVAQDISAQDESAQDTGAQEDIAQVQLSGKVVNNGGHFVECGDYVYYRVPQKGQLLGSMLWGKYCDTYIEGGSIMMAYNTKTGQTEELFADNGYGSIFIMGQDFYLIEESDEYGSYVEKVSRDGQERTSLIANNIYGVYDDLVIATNYNKTKERNEYILIQNCKEVKKLFFSDYENDPKYSNASLGYFVKIVGSNCLFTVQIFSEDDSEYDEELFNYNFDTDECICLGQLPLGEEVFPSWEIPQVEASQNQVWFSYGLYAGTGHFLYEHHFLTADLDEPNSLKEVDSASIDSGAFEQTEGDGAEDTIPGFVVSDGKIILKEKPRNTACAKWETDDLYYYDKNGDGKAVASGYGYVRDDEQGTAKEVELAEVVGDDIFLIQNEEKRDPDNDIGWREAYVRTKVRYDRISISDGQVTNLYELTE